MVFEGIDIYGRVPEAKTLVFEGIDIYGRMPRPPDKKLPPTVPRVYSAKKIAFEGTTDTTGKTVVFAGTGWLEEINHVAEILRSNATVHVEISAFVGPTWLAVKLGQELVGNTPAVHRKYGALMDARAKKVGDMLVLQGIDPARIHLSRGESGIGEAFRKVEFRFFVP